MSDTERDTLDRRALIRKGLIAAGAVAVAEVTVLAAPAFAASGVFRVYFDRDGNSANWNRMAPPADTLCGAGAFETLWDASANDPGPATIGIAPPPTGDNPVFTLTTPGCTFTDTRRSVGNNVGPCVGPTSNTGTVVTYTGATQNNNVYLIVTCT